MISKLEIALKEASETGYRLELLYRTNYIDETKFRIGLYNGYCADYPQLTDTIAFNIATGWIGARFLQMNGIAIRSPEETDRFLLGIKAAGIEMVDTTFFRHEGLPRHVCRKAGGFRIHAAFRGTRGGAGFYL